MRRSWLVLGVVLAVAGCGGGGASETSESSGSATASGSESTESSEGSESATASASGPSTPWDEMTQQQKGQYMREVVMPEMQRLFQEHDAERYADFSCATCHGENAREVGFEMPNGLAPLTHERIMATFGSEHPGAVFMTRTVWPRMAELLGEPQFDPQTGHGFACTNCHANADAAAH